MNAFLEFLFQYLYLISNNLFYILERFFFIINILNINFCLDKYLSIFLVNLPYIICCILFFIPNYKNRTLLFFSFLSSVFILFLILLLIIFLNFSYFYEILINFNENLFYNLNFSYYFYDEFNNKTIISPYFFEFIKDNNYNNLNYNLIFYLDKNQLGSGLESYLSFYFLDYELDFTKKFFLTRFDMTFFEKSLTKDLPFFSQFNFDGVSSWLLLLTAFLIVICIYLSSTFLIKLKEMLILLFLLEGFLMYVFTTTDIIYFYIFFEAVLIPMYLMIGIFGSRERKIFAAYQFFIYTFFGSVLMLISFIYIILKVQITNYQYLLEEINILFTSNEQYFIFSALFFAFAVKVPLIPVHTWLPEAHVEAPTIGSVLLAGILLKLGGFGIYKYILPLFFTSVQTFQPIIFVICIFGIIYTGLITIRQIDLKKIIAYSSVGHMSLAIAGLISITINGLNGGFFLLIAHGIVSSGLFILIGFLYDQTGTRNIFYYGGLQNSLPLAGVFFFLTSLANMGFPFLPNFIGEFLVILGTFSISLLTGFFLSTGMIFSSIYSLWTYNRIFLGLRQKLLYNRNFLDLKKRYLPIIFIYIFLYFLLGINPNVILQNTDIFFREFLYYQININHNVFMLDGWPNCGIIDCLIQILQFIYYTLTQPWEWELIVLMLLNILYCIIDVLDCIINKIFR